MRPAAMVVCALALFAAEASFATILTFDLDPLPADGAAIPSAYGDRVSGPSDATGDYGGTTFTPEIEVEYRTLFNGSPVWSFLSFWEDVEDGFPDVANVAFPNLSPLGSGEIVFTPDPGYRVVLNQFDVVWWMDNQETMPIAYYDANGKLLASTPTNRPPSGNATLAPGLVQSKQLRLRFGSTYDHGIDNISFDQEPARVLVIVLDDVGVELLEAYGEEEYASPPQTHPMAGLTPSIEQLAAEGLMFRNAWANPACSPTRASIVTGRHAFRHGVLTVDSPQGDLAASEVTLPEAIRSAAGATIATAAFGKWHVTKWDGNVSAYRSAAHAGFDWFRGAPGNLNASYAENGHYFSWLKIAAQRDAQGQATAQRTAPGSPHTVYATTDNVDDAITWLEQEEGPSLVWLAPNAPHRPYQTPPACLYEYDVPSDPDLAEKRMLQALDVELGWLLFGAPPDACNDEDLDGAHDHPGWQGVDFDTTTVIVIGDNGSAPGFYGAGKINKGNKGSIYEGGINVPLIATGAGVLDADPEALRESAALVHAVDVFPTVLDLLGIAPPSDIDGRSLVPLLVNPDLGPGDCTSQQPDSDPTCVRKTLYTDGGRDQLDPNLTGLEDRDLAVRNERWKLIREGTSDTYELYDLSDANGGANESDDLELNCALALHAPAEAAAAFAELRDKLDELTGTVLADPCETP